MRNGASILFGVHSKTEALDDDDTPRRSGPFTLCAMGQEK